MTASANQADLTCVDLGRISYDDALEIQHRLVAHVQSSSGRGAYALFLEHDPPVITLGRRAGPPDVLASPERLAALGVDLRRSRRGGRATWHGPGQLVAYPILRLGGPGRTVRGYVRSLEQAVLRLAEAWGVAARRDPAGTGVWVGTDKLAAIGVAVSRWVAYHGLALNVSNDLGGFDLIVPCGLAGRGVTSLSRILRREVALGEVREMLAGCLCEELRFGRVRWADRSALPPT